MRSSLRFVVAPEYEATHLYMQLAVETLKDRTAKELVQAGEFLRLLRELVPNEEKFFGEGVEEVEKDIKKMK